MSLVFDVVIHLILNGINGYTDTKQNSQPDQIFSFSRYNNHPLSSNWWQMAALHSSISPHIGQKVKSKKYFDNLISPIFKGMIMMQRMKFDMFLICQKSFATSCGYFLNHFYCNHELLCSNRFWWLSIKGYINKVENLSRKTGLNSR